MKRLCVVAVAAYVVAAAAADETRTAADPPSFNLQNEFDHIGAEVHSLSQNGRVSHYIDEGSKEGRAVVFIGGQGTSLEAFQLTEFARTMREELGLRVISVERNGFGESEFDPDLGYADFVKEVLAVLAHLGIDRFVVVAISGGGAYAAHLAATAPNRVISLHAAAATSRTLPTRTKPDCSRSVAEWKQHLAATTQNPKSWWGVAEPPVQFIPGWQTRSHADATRSFYVGGQLGDPAALAHEYSLFCSERAVADASLITAPAYLYYGDADTKVTVKEMEQWQAALPNVAKATVYPGEGHRVQYRHWDQILVDMAGHSGYTVVCRGEASLLIPDAGVREDEHLGICAWDVPATN